MRTLKTVVAVGILVIAGAIDIGYAHADGFDRHVPQPLIGYCPGGGSGGLGNQFCDGIDFPDGTFIHTSHGFLPFVGWTSTVYCASTHDFMPAQAGPGGCAGLL